MPTAAVAGGSAAIAVAAMWLPWFRSGSAGRNSFAAFRAAQVLDIEWITPFRVAWFLLPVVLLVAAALWLFRIRIGAVTVLLVLGLLLGSIGGLAVATLGAEWARARPLQQVSALSSLA